MESNKTYMGRYEYLKDLGEGGMAKVVKAYDNQLKRDVAVKIINVHLLNESYIKRFKSEAEGMALLNHPYIATIYDYFVDENIPHIVMEYVDNGTLDEYLNNRSKIDITEILRIMLQISEALKYSHSKKIVHRDIKPSNILIRKDGIIKLSDFGISKILDKSTESRTKFILGTYPYISPEQAKGIITSYTSDVYSLGIVFYFMLTGKLPIESDSEVGFIYKHIQEIPTRPSILSKKLPKKLDTIVMKMLEKDPNNRYSNIDFLITDLKNINCNIELKINKITSIEENHVFDKEFNNVENKTIAKTVKLGIDKNQKKEKSDIKFSFLKKLTAIITVLCILGFGGKFLYDTKNSDKNEIDSSTKSSKNNTQVILDDKNKDGNIENFSKNLNEPQKVAEKENITKNNDKKNSGQTSKSNENSLNSFNKETENPTKVEDVSSEVKSNEDIEKKYLIDETYVKNNLKYIAGGEFDMGTPEDEPSREDDELAHSVKISAYYIGKFEVSVKEFNTFIEHAKYTPISVEYNYFNKNDSYPVVEVTWYDAKKYCEWLSTNSNGMTFRLPTEAEWEYACRAGIKAPFSFGNNLTTNQANYDGNYPYNGNQVGKFLNKLTPIGSYSPNKWGLYDMHGNVSEWCEDWFINDYYTTCNKNGTVVNPKGPSNGTRRCQRGGSWNGYALHCRSGNRADDNPADAFSYIGFRVVMQK